jgi:hypothetical protein
MIECTQANPEESTLRNHRNAYARRRAGVFGAALQILFAGVGVAQIAPGPGVNPRAVWSAQPEDFQMRVVANGFEDPWEVTWGPDNHLWITERTARRVVRVDPLTGERTIAVTVDDAIQMLAQDGLLGLALHPDFLRGRSDVYVMYSAPWQDTALHVRSRFGEARQSGRRSDRHPARSGPWCESYRLRARWKAVCKHRRSRRELFGVHLQSNSLSGAAECRADCSRRLEQLSGKDP